MTPFPAKTPTEDKVLTFDFSKEVAVGTVLTAPVVAKSLGSGTDIGVSLTLGLPTVSALTVLVLASAGLDGNVYDLTCTVNGASSEVHQILASMLVSVNAA